MILEVDTGGGVLFRWKLSEHQYVVHLPTQTHTLGVEITALLIKLEFRVEDCVVLRDNYRMSPAHLVSEYDETSFTLLIGFVFGDLPHNVAVIHQDIGNVVYIAWVMPFSDRLVKHLANVGNRQFQYPTEGFEYALSLVFYYNDPTTILNNAAVDSTSSFVKKSQIFLGHWGFRSEIELHSVRPLVGRTQYGRDADYLTRAAS